MMITKLLVMVCMMGVAAPAVGQEEQGGDKEQLVQRLVQLRHADAAEAVDLLRTTLRCRAGMDRRTNSIVISGPADVVYTAEKMLAELDMPPREDEDVSSALIRVRDGATPRLMDLMRTQISGRTTVAIDPETSLIALRGPSKEIDALHEFIAQIEAAIGEDAREDPGTSAVRVSFYFLMTSTEPEPSEDDNTGSPIPPSLVPAVEVLEENGFYRPSLLMPLMVHVQSDESYDLSGRAEVDGVRLRVQIHGDVEIVSSSGTANLDVEAMIVEDSEQVTPLFEIGSRLSARIGDLVVLAATPTDGEGRATALVVRVMPTE